jgi:ADP-ribose pyrophosphatase YjhB (NUDIX family)
MTGKPKGVSKKLKYCNNCGLKLDYRIPEGDDRPRFICDACQTIHYENPKMVVGCIPAWKDRILLCRRSIEPRYGKWTIPAGFFEQEETVEAGAKRELYEEACATVEFLEPYGLYNLAFISQVYLIFQGPLKDKNFRAGHESLETRLFKEREIPWDDLAFSVVRKVLRRYFEDFLTGVFPFHMGDILPEMGVNQGRW